MRAQPVGTVTFLFADIEGSQRVLETLGPQYSSLFTQLRQLLQTTADKWHGETVDVIGDSLFVAFPRAADAIAAAAAVQETIRAHSWPDRVELRVRIGVHTGEPLKTPHRYVGIDVNRAARICAAAHGGQMLLSETTRRAVAHGLPDGVSVRDLGEHLLKDLAQPQHLFQVVASGLPSEFPPLRSLTGLPNNLPIQLTSFIGREREMAEVRRLLSATRLLTLTGAGGCGKTRLALHVAAETLEEFSNGVWLVELATLPDPALVPQQVALSLGIREQPGRPILATLLDYLRGRNLLLVLDNCEHLVTACAQLTEALLRACPNIRILTTSREPLGLTGETIWPVPPLPTPHPEHLPPLVDQLHQFEAVNLFVDRARTVLPDFALTSQNAAAVVSTTHRLDGIPLALELAAARVKVLSVEEIALRLDDRFRLLTGGSRTALPRHQTLRATMDWSYDLIAEPERVLFRRLSVFVGGFTLQAAEAVCARQDLAPQDVLDLLTHLVDKSLVMVEAHGGAARYRMLDSVWQYSREKLLESGEATPIRQRHRDWMMELVTLAEPQLQGPAQKVWLDRLEAEHDNLRTALEWSQTEPAGADAGVWMAGGLWWFWFVRGYWTEGRERLERALTTSGSAPGARAKAETGAAVLAGRQGDYRRAARLGEESLKLYREVGDTRGAGFALNVQGYLARLQGDYARAAALCAQSLQIAREVGDAWGTALALFILGEVALTQGDYKRARTLLEESLALYRERGDTWGIGFAQNNLGLVARQLGDIGRAERLCADSLTLFRDLDDKWGVAGALRSLGIVAHGRGDYRRAAALYADSLALYRELGDKWGMASSLRSLGLIAYHDENDRLAATYLDESLTTFREIDDTRGIADALQSLGLLARRRGDIALATTLWRESLSHFWQVRDKLGVAQCVHLLAASAAAVHDHDRAARLCGAMESLQAALGVPVSRHEHDAFERLVATVRNRIGVDRFSTAHAEGAVMPLDRVVQYAIADEAQTRDNDTEASRIDVGGHQQ